MRITFDQTARHIDGLVGGIVENLNIELLAGIVELAGRFQQAFDHILFIENRQLHRDSGQVVEMSRRFGRTIGAVLVIEINQNVAVGSVTREQDEYDEIRNQQLEIEGVHVVNAAEGGIEKVLLDVVTDALRGGPVSRHRR